MKIAFPFCNDKVGGAEVYAINLAQSAIGDGHEVIFFLSKEGIFSDRLKQLNIPFIMITMESSFNPLAMIRSVLALRRNFSHNNIDLVHTNMLREHSLSIGAKFLGSKVPVVRTFHRLDQFNWKMKPLLWFYNWQTDAFVAITGYLKQYLEVNGIKKEKIATITNGVAEVKVKDHKHGVGFLGRLAPEKGIRQLLEENEQEMINSSNLVIAGTGPDESSIKEIIDQRGLDVRMLGEVQDLENFFSQISVLILPSKSEVLPLAVLEAFSCGVPVVTFRLPSLGDIITENNGILVRPSDFRSLMQSALDLSQSNAISTLSQAARIDYQEKYTLELMWQETMDLYKTLLK